MGPHILYSRNAVELAQFLSELLDMDIFKDHAQSIIIRNEIISFQVIQVSDQSLLARTAERDTILCFHMDSLQSLEDLLYKVQFLSYRHGDSSRDDEKRATLHQQKGEYFFFLKDLDGRRWKFSFNS
jgi:hypothetical protein